MSQIQIDILTKALTTNSPTDVEAAARLVCLLAADANNDSMRLITDLDNYVGYHERNIKMRNNPNFKYDYSAVELPTLQNDTLTFCALQSFSGQTYKVSVDIKDVISNLENTEFLAALLEHVDIVRK